MQLVAGAVEEAGVDEGDAAAGGVGLMACQWARADGVRLIATAGTDEKCALALEHGASHAINSHDPDLVGQVRRLTDGRGVDVVMDGVGRDTFAASLDCLRPLGMMISFGNASGKVPPFDIEKPFIDEIAGVKMESYIDWMRSCYTITVTSHPALSVPAGFTDGGLPVGLHLIGRHQGELALLQMGHAFEQATKVGMRRPIF